MGVEIPREDRHRGGAGGVGGIGQWERSDTKVRVVCTRRYRNGSNQGTGLYLKREEKELMFYD